MTAKTRRLRELIASGEFLYMPSAATPLEGRLAEAVGTPLVYTGGYVSGASRGDHRAAVDDGRAGADRRRGGARRRRCRWSPMPAPGSASRCTRCARCASSPPPGWPASISRTSSTRSGRITTAIRCTRSRAPSSSTRSSMPACSATRPTPISSIIARSDTCREFGLDEAIGRINAAAEVGADMGLVFPRSREEAEAAPRLSQGAAGLGAKPRQPRRPADPAAAANCKAMGYRGLHRRADHARRSACIR